MMTLLTRILTLRNNGGIQKAMNLSSQKFPFLESSTASTLSLPPGPTMYPSQRPTTRTTNRNQISFDYIDPADRPHFNGKEAFDCFNLMPLLS